MGEFASKGVAGTGLGLGIAGTALGLLNNNGGNGILGNLFGNNCGMNNAAGGMALNALAEKDAKIARLEAERHSDTKLVDVYQQTLRDNQTLRDELFQFINPIATEAGANRERIAVLEAQHKCEVEKALLREQLIQSKIDNCCCEMNGKINSVAQTASCGIAQLNNAVAALNTQMGNITKTVIPTSAICPEVMPRYNSWTAPTTTTPAT